MGPDPAPLCIAAAPVYICKLSKWLVVTRVSYEQSVHEDDKKVYNVGRAKVYVLQFMKTRTRHTT